MCRYYSVSIFCKVGAPGYIASVVFGIVATVAAIGTTFTIDKVRCMADTLQKEKLF